MFSKIRYLHVVVVSATIYWSLLVSVISHFQFKLAQPGVKKTGIMLQKKFEWYHMNNFLCLDQMCPVR